MVMEVTLYYTDLSSDIFCFCFCLFVCLFWGLFGVVFVCLLLLFWGGGRIFLALLWYGLKMLFFVFVFVCFFLFCSSQALFRDWGSQIPIWGQAHKSVCRDWGSQVPTQGLRFILLFTDVSWEGGKVTVQTSDAKTDVRYDCVHFWLQS